MCGLFRRQCRSRRGNGRGHRVARADEIENKFDFFVFQRQPRVKARHEITGRSNDVRRAVRGVVTRDRNLGDEGTVEQVTKIDQARYLRCVLWIDQHIVGVSILMNHLVPQSSQARENLLRHTFEYSVDIGLMVLVDDVLAQVFQPRAGLNIPGVLRNGGRVKVAA